MSRLRFAQQAQVLLSSTVAAVYSAVFVTNIDGFYIKEPSNAGVAKNTAWPDHGPAKAFEHLLLAARGSAAGVYWSLNTHSLLQY